MLTYFHKNKLRYEKGQLAPFFILILVVLLVMAMVTVNLSKVAFIKTDSSNAVDSGALAAGSVMANVFNAIAQSNSQMEVFYWEFYASISVLFVTALTYLTMAYASASAALVSAGTAAGAACGDPCAAIGPAAAAYKSAGAAIASLNNFWWTTTAISVAITAFSLAQYYYYLSIRDMAKKGREQAIKLGHRFAFINSGIGSKLREGSPPEELTESAQKNNYRNEFSKFLDNIGESAEYTYPWEDGQEREHFVYSKVAIDEVGTFDLQVTVLPTLAVGALLTTSSMLASSAQESLGVAKAAYTTGHGLLKMACVLRECCFVKKPTCCAAYDATCASAGKSLGAGMAANSAAIASMTPIFGLMATAWAGLLPGPIITSSSTADALPFIISWIDDIVHNRLVRVDTEQHHEGTDLGLWQSKYPDTKSYSVVNFTGEGDIHPPKLNHDPSIIETDKIGSSAP